MIYLFTIEVTDPGHRAEDYADAWVRASELIQRQPGARGTRLHRCSTDDRKLLAIATWDSKASRDAMEADPPAGVEEIIASQVPHVRIERIGEFEDPDWVVLPPTA